MVVEDVGLGQLRDVPRAPPWVPGVGMIAVDEPPEQEIGAEGRVVAVGLEFGGGLPPRPGQGLGGEGRADDQVGQPLDGRSAGPRRGPAARRRWSRLRACRRRPRWPRPARRPGGSGSLPRASGRSSRRDPASPRGAAGIDEQLQRDHARPGPRLGQEAHPVGQDTSTGRSRPASVGLRGTPTRAADRRSAAGGAAAARDRPRTGAGP